ncbi:hypothetical protein ScPMuIL_001874 [Solemya velum]
MEKLVPTVAVLALVGLGLSEDVSVHTNYGDVLGYRTDKSQVFKGIPYASPPVGQLRWKNPEDPTPWSPNVYNAQKLKPGCPQKECNQTQPPMVCPNQTSEDCLFLNVWTPLSSNASSRLPVMLYIHGGNFIHMSASSILYDGEMFVKKGQVVLVTINYRLGALGFLYTGGGEQSATGNYGIFDQRLAMKWVYENIANFGGDPTKVTLFGQSAGAQSTMLHLMLDHSETYFRAAILESMPFGIPLKNTAEALVLGRELSTHLDCGTLAVDLDCLRSKTADEVAEAQAKTNKQVSSLKLLEFFEPWGPIVDEREIGYQPLVAVQHGQFFKKPIMVGTTSEETFVFIHEAWHDPVNLLDYGLVVTGAFTTDAPAVLLKYPPVVGDNRGDLSRAGTEFVFSCPSRNATRNMIKHSDRNVWMYLFNHALSFPGWGPNLTFCEGHVCHGAEIPYVFQTAGLGGFQYTPDEIILSDLLIKYFTNFASNLDPNIGQNIELKWPKYGEGGIWPLVEFKTPASTLTTNYIEADCNFWDAIGYKGVTEGILDRILIRPNSK